MVKDIGNQGGLRFHESEVQNGITSKPSTPATKKFPNRCDRAFSTSSARSVATTANTPSGCSTVPRHKKTRQPPRVVAPLLRLAKGIEQTGRVLAATRQQGHDGNWRSPV